jgi:hypothetical protein
VVTGIISIFGFKASVLFNSVSFWPHYVFGQKYLFVKDASQGFNYSEVLQSQKISGSLSAIRTMCHTVRTPICHYFIRPNDVPYRPDARQTKHNPFGRRAFPSGPSTVSSRFCPTCIRPDVSAARPDASLYSNIFKFFPSSNKVKINQPSGRCGIPSGRASP